MQRSSQRGLKGFIFSFFIIYYHFVTLVENHTFLYLNDKNDDGLGGDYKYIFMYFVDSYRI